MTEDKDEQGYSPSDSQQNRGKDTFRRGANVSDNFMSCPECPEIKKKIDRIYIALLGGDGICLTDGLVKEITDLKTKFGALETAIKTQRSTNSAWVSWIKPVVGGVSVVAISQLIIFFVTHHI